MTKQKALLIPTFDGVTKDNITMQLTEIDIPKPAEGEVLVHVTLRPVNPTDVYEMTGVYREVLPSPPLVNGSEGYGVVQSDNGKKFKKGQRVVAAPWNHFAGAGTWQQYVNVPEESLVAVPDSVSDEAAAQFLINPVTAVGMVRKFGQRDGWLLHTGANGSLGKMLIPIARKHGVKLINVVRRSAAKEELAHLKPDAVIATDKEDLVQRVNEITDGKGVDAALDGVGGEFAAQVVGTLKQGGRLVPYGALGGLTMSIPFLPILVMGKMIKGFMIFNWLASMEAQEKQEVLQEVMQLIVDGTIKLEPCKRFPLEQWQQAVEYSQKPGRGGKAMLEG
eukprot:jgi/Astpho2/5555/Aster-02815